MQPDRADHEPDPEPELEPELKRAIDAWQPAPARAAFREQLRALFLGAEATGVDDAAPAGKEPAPALTEALDAYLPEARAEFRDSLRAAFVSGAIAQQSSTAGSAAEREESAPRVAQAHRGRWRLRLLGVGGLLATAAALVLWVLQPVHPRWSFDPEGFVAAGLSIDGITLSADTPLSEVDELLSTANSVSTTNALVRLVLGELLMIEMAEFSTLDLSLMPADLSRGDLVLRAREGSFRLVTGPEFKVSQRTLRVETDDVDVEVVGTVFGVELFPTFTCVCCLEGEVATRLKNEPATLGTVRGESTNIVYKDGTPVKQTRFEPHMLRLRTIRNFWER